MVRRLLERERNTARWIEYSVSASLMIVLIAMLTGVSDVGALIAIVGVNAAMIFFGMVMEHTDPTGDPTGCPSSSAASPAPCRGS